MFIIDNYALAVLFCFITMICWGSWANTQKLASQKWPFQLFYWDYTFGILLITLFFAFTLGSVGDGGRSFLHDLEQILCTNGPWCQTPNAYNLNYSVSIPVSYIC